MTKTLTISKAQEDLPILVRNTKTKSTQYVITVHGTPYAILAPISSDDEPTSESETREILADKKLMRDIRQAEKEIAEGKVHDWEDIKKELGFDEL